MLKYTLPVQMLPSIMYAYVILSITIQYIIIYILTYYLYKDINSCVLLCKNNDGKE